MNLRKRKPEVMPSSEYRLDKEQIQFLSFALQIGASEAKDRESRIRLKEAHAQILTQAADQIAGNYPSHDPARNTANIALDETEHESVGEALDFIVKLDRQSKRVVPGSKLGIWLGGTAMNPSASEIMAQSSRVAADIGETARNLQRYLGFVDPQ